MEKQEAKADRILQIDIIKALAILSVIALHSIPSKTLSSTLAAFHIRQAVPVFFIIMGLNAAYSLTRLDAVGSTWNKFKRYFSSRFDRIIYPYMIVLVIDLVIGFVRGDISLGPGILMGQLPVGLPGNYFVSAVIQFILVFPVIYRLYRRYPRATLVASFIASFGFEIIAPRISFFQALPFYYRASILRYLSAIALGLWISDGANIFSRRNAFILIGAIGSVAYLLATSLFSYEFPLFFPSSNTPYMLSVFYPAVLVLVGLKYLPSVGLPLLARIGRMSYHIFLVQMVFLAVVPIRDLGLSIPGAILLNASTTIVVAYVFYAVERGIKRYVLATFGLGGYGASRRPLTVGN